MTDERRDAIIRLLRTRDENLPFPTRRDGAPAGFVHVVTDARGREANVETCPDCLANDRVMFGCESCGGSGHVRAPRKRDPYATEVVLPFGFDLNRRDAANERDRQIDALDRQLARPRSEADLLEEANAHPFAWEAARRRMYRNFDYGPLDRALEALRVSGDQAYRALHAVYVYGWLERVSPAVEEILERGLAFIDERMPDPLRAPAAAKPPTTTVSGPMRPEAGKATKIVRDREMRAAADAGATLAELMARFGVSKSTVYAVVNRKAAA